MKRILTRYFNSSYLPALAYICLLVAFSITSSINSNSLVFLSNILFWLTGGAFLGIIAASVWNYIQKRWRISIINIFLVFACGVVTVFAMGFLVFSAICGSSKDGFADNLTIPEGIEIATPEQDSTAPWGASSGKRRDEFQNSVRRALSVPGTGKPEFVPAMPSLRKASTDHFKVFLEYLEASPNWHVFTECGNLFASRRWSYEGEPRDTLHGYISDFSAASKFQTRCLLCLDRKQWGRYSVQHVLEGSKSVNPEIRLGNRLQSSQIMIECGGVWVEIFEESDNPERRVTKATIANLEKEFSEFLKDPEKTLNAARSISNKLADRLAGEDKHRFRLFAGMQPGMYCVEYLLNPGAPGSVYLKAYEVTKGTPLSAEILKEKSNTRMAWSSNNSERFFGKAGFTIYEGDWGKPYAARFEVWFTPDSKGNDKKLAERVFKIEGWQR